jgi:hypothetical protein
MSGESWSLRVVTPMYFDTESLLILRGHLLSALRSAAERGQLPAPQAVRFIVIDDSAGRDPEVARFQSCEDTTIIQPPFNLGHQRAIVYGLRTIAPMLEPNEIVVTMDADGEDQPEDVVRLVQPLLAAPRDAWMVAIARRTKRHETLSFKALYLAFTLLFRVLTGRAVRSGNFAAYSAAYARRNIVHPYFDLCYSATLISLNRSPEYVPCARGTRYAGESRMGMESLLAHGVRMLMPFADRIAIRSLAFFATLAVSTAAFTAVVVVGHYLAGWAIAPWVGWILAVGVLGSGLALANFLVLFSGFAQASALALNRLEPREDKT